MTNFKEYFRSHLKANIRPLICIFATVFIITYLLAHDGQMIPRDQWYFNYKATLYIPVIFLCILAYVLPVMEFSFFKKRINLDCAYALPISRRAMGCVHYLSGLATLFCAFSLSYLVNFFLLLSRGPGHYTFLPLLPHYFLCLLLGFVMYSFMVFVFCEGNTKGDGIWFVILYTFVFFLINIAAFDLKLLKGLDSLVIPLPWGPIAEMTTYYQNLAEFAGIGKIVFWKVDENVGYFIFWVLVGIASALGFFFTFGKRRMEKTEEVSESYFGFRTLIPIYAVCGMISFDASSSIITWVIIELFTLLGYTIYRRGFRYRKSDIVILASLLVFLFI